MALTTPKDRTTVKSKGFGAAHSAVVKKNLSSVVQKNVTKDLLDNFLHQQLVLEEL